MAAGCMLFIGFQKRKSIEQFLEKVPPIIVLAFIIAVMYLPKSLATISTVTVVVLSLVLIASLKKGTTAYKFFTIPEVVYIGLISYSLYLWHWGVLSISRWTIGIHWWSIPFQVALMFGLAITSYRYIETPLRKGNWFGKRWKTLIVGGGVIFTLAGGLIALGKSLKKDLFLGDKILISQMGNLTNFSKSDFFDSKWNTKNCVFSSNNDVGKKVNFEECSLKTYQANKPTILVIGNSQNVAQIRMYERVVEKGFNVILTSAWGCHIPKRLKTQNTWRESCNYYQENVIEALVSNLKNGDIVALISDFSSFSKSDNPYLKGFDMSEGSILVNGKPSDNRLRNYEFVQGINNLAKQLDSMGVSIVVQHMGPLTRGLPEVQECVSVFKWIKKSCEYHSKSEHLKARKNFDNSLIKLHTNNSNLFVFDPMNIACPNASCSYLSSNGKLLYRDTAHFSDYASAIMSDKFFLFLKNI